MGDVEHEVLVAAARVVTAFGTHRTEEYFACFAPHATFLFHNHPELLTSRQAYRKVWTEWERDGFRVLGCRSLQPSVSRLDDDHAVFTHRVRTTLATPAGGEDAERETMVFARSVTGEWLVVHEHLSADPQPGDPVEEGR